MVYMYVLSSDEASDYLKEIVNKDRIIRVKDTIYVLCLPTTKQQRDADKIQALITSNLLQDKNIPTKSQARKILIERLKDMGKDETYLEKQSQIQQKIAKILADNTSEKQAKQATVNPNAMVSLINDAIHQLSDDDVSILQDMQEIEELQVRLYSGTVEHMAAMEKDLYLMSICVHDADGNLVWGMDNEGNNLIDNDPDIERVQELQQEFAKFITGLPSTIAVTVDYEDIKDKLKKE
jgi:ribosomal protein L36